MAKKTSFDPANPFGDLGKMFEQFKVPGVDMNAIIEARRKDMEALMAANVATYEAVQALAKKQTEILTQALQSAQENSQKLTSGGLPAPAKQAELVRTAYDKAVADMKELAEMARKAQTDIMEAITKRAQQSLQEIQALVQPK